MANIEQAARGFATAIWTEHKLTDPTARPIVIEDTVEVLLREVESIVHEWEDHREIRYVENGVHKTVKRTAVR